jgi:hypothetical protein
MLYPLMHYVYSYCISTVWYASLLSPPWTCYRFVIL